MDRFYLNRLTLGNIFLILRNMKTSQEKINKIKETLACTREKRKFQICKSYFLKIDYSHTNNFQKEWLKKIFIEAKWFYNYILNQEDIFDVSISKNKEVSIKVLGEYEKRTLLYLSSQMKQSLQKRIHNAVKALSVLKRHKFSYEKISNIKKDKVNKLVSYLKGKYGEIFIQDEQIANWHKGLFGKQVQHSALGAIKSKLKSLESTFVLDKWQPTTKLCPNCGLLNKVLLSGRVYTCICGYSQDRDIHSAKNILLIGQKQKINSVMGRNSTTFEDWTSESLKSNFQDSSRNSMKMEACS